MTDASPESVQPVEPVAPVATPVETTPEDSLTAVNTDVAADVNKVATELDDDADKAVDELEVESTKAGVTAKQAAHHALIDLFSKAEIERVLRRLEEAGLALVHRA